MWSRGDILRASTGIVRCGHSCIMTEFRIDFANAVTLGEMKLLFFYR